MVQNTSSANIQTECLNKNKTFDFKICNERNSFDIEEKYKTIYSILIELFKDRT
jgi:hypothetical protein